MIDNSQIDAYFKDTYSSGDKITVTQLPNGGYHVLKNKGAANGCELYIPPNFDSSDVKVVAHLPGSGGDGDARILRNSFKGNDAPDHIIAIASHYQDGGDMLGFVSDVCEDNNLNVTDLSLTTFSASGAYGFASAEGFSEKNPDTNITMFVADGYSKMGGAITEEHISNVDSLANSNASVYLILPDTNPERQDDIFKSLLDKGVNTNIILTSRTKHSTINNDLLESELAEYSIGIVDHPGGKNLNSCNYTIIFYNPKTNEFESTTDLNLIQPSETTYTNFQILDTSTNSHSDGTLGADLYSIGSSINSVRGTLNINEYQNTYCEGTSNIPSQLSNVQSSFVNISNNLNALLASETNVIASIAQTIYDMDVERANAAISLSDGSGLLSSNSSYSDFSCKYSTLDLNHNTISFDKFLFNTGSHVEGNSGKICMSDIDAMLGGSSLTGPLHENFEAERISATQSKREIDNLISLISSNNNFQGQIWNNVADKLESYSTCMQMRIESANKLESAMVESLKLIKNYMGDYEELDDSRLPELRQRIVETKAAIEQAKTIMTATKTVTHTYEDEKGILQYYYTTEFVYSADVRQQAKAFIEQATLLIEELTNEVTKLEGLPAILAQAEQIINDAINDVYSTYAVNVQNIVVGNESNFVAI